MKKIGLILTLLLFVAQAQAQFKISGKLRSLKTCVISVEDMNGKIIINHEIDKTGSYETKPVKIQTDIYKVKIDKFEMIVLLENTPIVINGFYNEQEPKKSDIQIHNATLHNQYIKLMSEYLKVENAKPTVKTFLESTPSVVEQLAMLSIVTEYENRLPIEYEIFRDVLTKCKDVKKKAVYAHLQKMVDERKAFAIGEKAFNFSAKDVTDKVHSLADYKGKIVLLDFWASWCGPCRAEMKSLHAIYEEIKGDDLQFISISLDDEKESWMKALEADKIPWLALWENAPNVSGKKKFGFFDSVIRPKYGFRQIPFIVLLDKEGRVVKRFLRGEQVKNEIELVRTIKK